MDKNLFETKILSNFERKTDYRNTIIRQDLDLVKKKKYIN